MVLTPEEWVRQHVVALLRDHRQVPSAQIIVEYPIELNGQRQRADIVVVSPEGEAILMCECKAPEVKISQATLDQAVRYNSILKARYVLLTNGMKNYLYERQDSEGGYRSLASFDDIEF